RPERSYSDRSVTPVASSSTTTPLAVSGAPSDVRKPTPRGAGLRVKFLILVSIGFIASGLVFGWAFSRQYQQMLRSEFMKRGETLVRGLAANGRLDVWAGNKERLNRLVESAREDSDVAAASVYNSQREMLARAEKVVGASSAKPPAVPRFVVVE